MIMKLKFYIFCIYFSTRKSTKDLLLEPLEMQKICIVDKGTDRRYLQFSIDNIPFFCRLIIKTSDVY
jgi:hypothetical protein